MNFFSIPFAFVYALVVPIFFIFRLFTLPGFESLGIFFAEGDLKLIFFPVLIYISAVLISMFFIFLMKKCKSRNIGHVIFMFLGLFVSLIFSAVASILYGLLVSNFIILSFIGLIIGLILLLIFFGISRFVAYIYRIINKQQFNAK